ncbi:MAG: hypothetical protein WC437_02320 [Patescibacteria group bacterium]|jgi:hypothetical protein|nr:hypothetical protein [Patescibacteria group bacterium]
MAKEALNPVPEHESTWVAPTEAETEEALKDLSKTGPTRITNISDIDKLPEADVQIGTEADADEAITIAKPKAERAESDNVVDVEEARRRLRDLS